MGILNLPNELILLIGEHLATIDLSYFLSACRRLWSVLTPSFRKRSDEEPEIGALQWAAIRGDVSLVELAISEGAEIDKCSGWLARTALYLATYYNHPEIIRILIAHGATISVKCGTYGSTPLHCAATSGFLEATRVLLDLGADMMCRDTDGDTPAHRAVVGWGSTQVEILRLFIDAGFDPHTRGDRGRTILHVAVKNENKDAVNYLLRQKKVGIPINARDSHGKTALDWAKDAQIIRQLTEATKQVEGGDQHRCSYGCYHRFSLRHRWRRI